MLTAKIVPHSSVVGGSVAVHDERGAVVALLAVMVPDPSRDYKETATPIIQHIANSFPMEAKLVKRPVAFRYKNAVDQWVYTENEAETQHALNTGHDAQGLYVRDGT